jgi:hypothetical protein
VAGAGQPQQQQQQQGFTAAQIAAALRPRAAAWWQVAPQPQVTTEQSISRRKLAAANAFAVHTTTTTTTTSSSSYGGGELPPCRLSDPFCFNESECYCKLPNGTFGAACPMYGSCLGACCSTTGVCPDRMGFEDPVTGQQSVLLPKSCADWGLNQGGAAPQAGVVAGLNKLECRLPKGRGCVVGTGAASCMGYTVCKGGGCAGASTGEKGAVGAMCVYSKGGAQQFAVCSCVPVY